MYNSLMNIDTLFDCYDVPVLLEAALLEWRNVSIVKTHTHTRVRTRKIRSKA